MNEAARELMELGTRRLIYLLKHEPSKITPHAIVRAVEAAAGLLRDSRTSGSGPRVLPEGVGEAVEAIIDEYARRALAGEHEAARVVLMAAQRKAAAEGTDSPQRQVVGLEANQRMMFGDAHRMTWPLNWATR